MSSVEAREGKGATCVQLAVPDTVTVNNVITSAAGRRPGPAEPTVVPE